MFLNWTHLRVIVRSAFLAGLLALIGVAHASAQNQAAQAALTNSLAAMGGQARWSQVSDATVKGKCTSLLQQGAQTVPFRWIVQQNQFRYEYGQTGELTATLSNNGNPFIVNSLGSQPLTAETANISKPYHLPGLIFQRVLSDANFQATMVGNENLNGEATVHIHIAHQLMNAQEAGAGQDWWLDASTYLPVQVTYNVPAQAVETYVPFTYTFSSWGRYGNGFLIPQQLYQTMVYGNPAQTCTVTELDINSNPPASLFTTL